MQDKKVIVILEDLRSQFRVFSEGQLGLTKKTDSMMEMIAKNSEDITDLKIMVGKNTEDITELKVMVGKNSEDITELKVMVGKNSEDIEIIKSDIAFIKTELKKFVRVEEFEVLEKRVALIERKLSRI